MIPGGVEHISLAEQGAAEIIHVFSSPILKYYWPCSENLNAELKQVVLTRKAASAGVVKTNRGGWQSEADLHDWPEDCVKELMSRVQAAAREMVKHAVAEPNDQHLTAWKVRAWANVNTKGAFNKSHHHDGPYSLWSGFYYVDVGEFEIDQAISGRTVFDDRSGVPKEIIRNSNLYEREISIVPRAGMIVMFPARLYHYVEPYSGKGVRITIAFNLWHPGFAVPVYEGMREGSWWWVNFRGLMLVRSKIPEKLYGLSLIPGKLFETKISVVFWMARVAPSCGGRRRSRVCGGECIGQKRGKPRKMGERIFSPRLSSLLNPLTIIRRFCILLEMVCSK